MAVATIQRHEVPKEDQTALLGVARSMAHPARGARVEMVIHAEGARAQAITLPAAMLPALVDLVAALARDGEVSLVSNEDELTPEQAAAFVGMSRPMLMQRVKVGDIPHHMVGSHHRLRLSDVVRFKESVLAQDDALAEIGEHTDDFTMRHGP